MQVRIPSMRLLALYIFYLTNATRPLFRYQFSQFLRSVFIVGFHSRFSWSVFKVYYYFIYKCQYDQCDMILILIFTIWKPPEPSTTHRNPPPPEPSTTPPPSPPIGSFYQWYPWILESKSITLKCSLVVVTIEVVGCSFKAAHIGKCLYK